MVIDEQRTQAFDLAAAAEAERSNARNGNSYDDDERYGRQDQPAPAKMRGPQMPGANERWFTLPEPYDTTPPMRIRIWVNYPNRLADDIASGDEDLMYAAMARIVLEHNGWVDQDGEPYPMLARGDVDAFRQFWRAIPNECAQVISTLVGTATGKASASILNRAQRRGR